MKKRILSCLTALALCLTLLPTAALAAENGITVYSGEHTHSDWLASGYGTDAKTLVLRAGGPTNTYGDTLKRQSDGDWILPAGNYYLKNDITVEYAIVISSNVTVTICLNGKTITGQTATHNNTTDPVFRVEKDGKLTLTDCQENRGKVTHTGDTAIYGVPAGVQVLEGGIFNLYSGKISGNREAGVYLNDNNAGTFNLYGGEISGNERGVYVGRGGTFNMSGGTIKDHKNSKGVDCAGDFKMSDGTISGCGDGVYLHCYEKTNGSYGCGTFTMTGGTITENAYGVSLYAYFDKGQVLKRSKFTMTGGAITENTRIGVDAGATSNGSTSPHAAGGTLIVGGTAKIQNNGAKNWCNVFLDEGEIKLASTAFAEGAYIGITTPYSSPPTAEKPITIVEGKGGQSDVSGYFHSDNSKYEIQRGGDNAVLLTVKPHTHVWAYENVDKSTVSVSCKGTPGSCDYQTKPATVKISMTRSTYPYSEDMEAPKATLTHSANWPEGVAKAEESAIKYWKSNDGGNSHEVQITNEDGLKADGKYLAQLEFNEKWLEAYFSVVDNSKQDPKYTAPTAKTLTYNGQAQKLINPGTVAEGGEMQYSLERNGTYSTVPPVATDAGTYTVWYKVVGGAGYKDVAEQSIKVTIAKAKPTGTPKYTPITSSGKKLSDAKLTTDGSTFKISGTVEWEPGDTTEVKADTAYKWIFTPNDSANYETLTGTVVLYTKSTPVTPSQPGGGSSGSGGGGGGSSSDRDSSDSNPVIKTETKNHPDGSTTKTETRKDGSVTQTTTGKDGGTSKTETKKDGSSVTENTVPNGSTGTVKTDKNGQTEAKTALSNKAIEDAKKNGEAVKAPVEVEASRNSSTAPTVSIELPKNAGETEVEIPVSNAKPGTVAVLVHPDGTEEILKASVPTDGGIRLTVDGNATVKIVDNSKDFIDIRNHWAEDEIDFVSARELVNGVSDTIYAPNTSATRAQLWTILARQADAELNGGANWYEKAQNWAKDKGVSDGANPNAAINRAQMVTMLWRAMGQPTAGGAASFIDVPADSYYAQAVAWAIENGITTGIGGGKFDPNSACTRAQIAAFLARSMK